MIASAGILWVTGQGDSRFFAAGGGAFVSPPEDFGTLAQSGSNYVYTAKDQTLSTFNSAGQLVSVHSPNGQQLVYEYDSSGRLTQASAPDGGITNLSYTNGLLSRITEPGSRVVTLSDNGSNVAQITDEANLTRTVSYDGAHHVIEDQWSLIDDQFSYNTGGSLIGVNQGLGSVWTITPADLGGSLFTQQTGDPAEMRAVFASVTDPRFNTTLYALDGRGRLVEQVNPDGGVEVEQRDDAGQVVVEIDPLNRPTVNEFQYGTFDDGGDGDLMSTTYADGTTESFTYDPTFHYLATDTNADGEETVDTYDPNTGQLTTSTDAMGNRTQYIWSGPNLTSETSPIQGGTDTTTFSYDTHNRLTKTTDALGASTTFGYDSYGDQNLTTDAKGDKTLSTFDARGDVTGTIDANGGKTSDIYDAYGDVISSTDERNATTTTNYDQRGWETSQTDQLRDMTQTSWDVAGNPVQEIDADNNTTTTTFDIENRPVQTTDATGAVVDKKTYDLADEVTQEVDELGGTTLFGYNLVGEQTFEQDPLGRIDVSIFDAIGNEIGQITPAGLALATFDADNRPISNWSAAGQEEQTSYDPAGNVSQTIDALGLSTRYTYSALGQQLTTTDPMGHKITDSYDSLGELTSKKDALGRIASYKYDVLGRETQETDPEGYTLKTAFDATSNVVSTTNSLRGTTTFVYNAIGEQTSVKDATGLTTSQTFDKAGNVTSQTDGNGQVWQTSFDADNRPVVETAPGGAITQTSYNPAGEVLTSTDPNKNTTRNDYDADGEQINQTLAYGTSAAATTTTAYNALGLVSAVIDPDNNKTQYYYDSAGNLVETRDPLGNKTLSVYDADNRMTRQTDRDGRTTQWVYDADGRVTTATGDVYGTKTFTYDADDEMLTATNNLGTYTWTYTADGQTATQTDLWGMTLTYGYDGNGNATTVQDNQSGHLASVYDADNRPTSRTLTASGTAVREDWTYTPDSQAATARRYSGTSTANLIGQSAFTYDVRDNLTQVQHQNGSGTTLENFAYTYDTGDRLTAETDTNSAGTNTTSNYTYDANNQLLTAGSKTYSWDANGNQTSNGFASGANNQVSTDGTWNYSYDAEGDLIEKVKPGTGETWTYTYDNANHLVSATDKGSGGAVIAQVTEKYDALGQRVEEDTTTGGTTTVQRFSYDTDGNVWADLDGTNTIQTRRMYDDDGGLLARIGASGAVGWYLTDHLGSVRAIVNASGTVVDEKAFDAFGNLLSETSPTNGDRYGWDGYQWQATIGQDYVHARWYNPSTGTWTSQDPLGFGAGDSNLQRYVGNDTQNASDPTGTELFALGEETANRVVGWIQRDTGIKDVKAIQVTSTKRKLTSLDSSIASDNVYVISVKKGQYNPIYKVLEPLKGSGFSSDMYRSLTSWTDNKIVYSTGDNPFRSRITDFNLFSDFTKEDLAKTSQKVRDYNGFSFNDYKDNGGIWGGMTPTGTVHLKGWWTMTLHTNDWVGGHGHAWLEFTKGDIKWKVSSTGKGGNVSGYPDWSWNDEPHSSEYSISRFVKDPVIVPGSWGLVSAGVCSDYAIKVWNMNCPDDKINYQGSAFGMLAATWVPSLTAQMKGKDKGPKY